MDTFDRTIHARLLAWDGETWIYIYGIEMESYLRPDPNVLDNIKECKIGRSITPSQRRKALSLGNSWLGARMIQFPAPRDVEYLILSKWDDIRIPDRDGEKREIVRYTPAFRKWVQEWERRLKRFPSKG